MNQLVVNTINRLREEGGEGNYAIFDFKTNNYYIQIAFKRGADEAYCEAVSNQFLEGTAVLSPLLIEELMDLGWSAPKEGYFNYYCNHAIDSEDKQRQLAELITKTANLVYNCPVIKDTHITVNLE